MQLKAAIDEFILYIQIEKNYSSHMIISYEYDLNQFLAFVSDHGCSTDLNDLTKTNVRRYIQHQMGKQQQKPRSMNRKISCLKYCLQEKYLLHDFMNGIETPKTDDKLPVYMTLADLQQLFRSLEQDDSPFALRNETMFKLLATTGMRRSELVALTWIQLDFSNQTVRIYGKGKKERLLPLHPLLTAYKASLEPYQTYATELAFLNKDGNPLNPRGLHLIFKNALNDHLLKQVDLDMNVND